ncbi:hypothetical protein F5Y18DRAFT_150382 [Xylariaceae sp. FL1019]|nr:hypothetical protein F5Y18DRAFT_150382 [Xylariaceae sp. FL1019]
MSACRSGARLPLNGILQAPCLRNAPAARSRSSYSIQQTNPRCLDKDARMLYQVLQRRWQSSTGKRPDPNESKPESQPPLPPKKLILRALRQGLAFKPLFNHYRGKNLRNLFRQSPEELVLAFAILAFCAGAIVYVVYTYFNYFQSEQFTVFPPDVAKSMRRALYYTNYGPDAKLAHKYYTLALEQCKEHGLDPFSDEVMGIRIQVAAWLEKIGKYENAIDVLEKLLVACREWVETVEKSAKDGLIDNAGRPLGSLKAQAEARRPPEAAGEEVVLPENLWAKRSRVLGRAVGISVKIGELCADEHVLQGDAAGEHLIWAVETVLKEIQRRQVEGVKEAEGDWMTPEQTGGALEALANHYESKSLHYLAAPLYLQATTMSPPNSCHTAVLMNNLAISLAQQPVQSPIQGLPAPGGDQAPTRATLLASARSWASQALATADRISGENRTEECDEACAVAMCNLADIAAMTGDTQDAKRRFSESLALSKKIGFTPGVIQAQDGLKRVASAPAKA